MICDREESESTFYELISLFVLGGREDLPAPRIFLIRASLCGCQGASGREPREPDAGFSGIFSLVKPDSASNLPRKEVIQPHLPVRLPCYDFTPLTLHTFDASAPIRVRPAASGADDSGGVTGGVYKTRERIHRSILICDY